MPSAPSHRAGILPAHRGDAGTCLGLTLQPFRERQDGLHATRGNVLVSRHLWDPYQPGGTRGGVSHLPCEDPKPRCADIFLGDYFPMQISATQVSVLSASTHPRGRAPAPRDLRPLEPPIVR